MVLAKLIVFVSLYYVVTAASVGTIQGTTQSTNQGYLFMDTAEPASCYNMPSNQVCPSFNHQVVGVDISPAAVIMMTLHSVKTELTPVATFNDTQACLDDVREYSCSNSLMKCTTTNQTIYGFKLDYDVTRTQQACAKVKNSCSPHVQATTIHNCSIIQTDPFEFAACNKHTAVPGDICPSTAYMYPKAITKFYPIHTNSFKALLAHFAPVAKNATCKAEVIGVYCQIIRGGICSADMTKRMYAISQQDCSATMTKCIVNPGHKANLLEVCKLLPDGNTAPSVPLPTVSNSNSADNSGK